MVVATKGEASYLLEQQIIEACKPYSRLTCRQLYYILVSKYDYPPTRNFYKILIYHLVKLRRAHSDLYLKFVDTTRAFILPSNSYDKIELWVEKDAIRSFIEEVTVRYRVPLQVERGFGSISMFRDALIRARERGVKKILYVGDHDPSGLVIEAVNVRETGLLFERIAVTLDQVKRFNSPSRPVNIRDSRTPAYISLYGNRCFEVEALDPFKLLNIVEEKLKSNVPAEFIDEAQVAERASRIAKELTEDLLIRLEREAYELVKQDMPEGDIITQLASKYSLRRFNRSA